MNNIIKALMSHQSTRKFTEEPVSEEQLKIIIKAAQSAPSSINGQQVSLIVIKDKETRNKMSEYGAFQSFIKEAPVFILFCADFRRSLIACEINNTDMYIQENLESILVGSIDAGLQAAFATVALESMGLGGVIVGGLRQNMKKIIELTELPQLVFPLFGLVIGHPAEKNLIKPRLPMEAVAFNEKYDNKNLKNKILEYDKDYADYTLKRGGSKGYSWSSRVAQVYGIKNIFPEMPDTIREQGFKA